MRRLCAVLASLSLVTGCYRWESIKPSELPKLNDAAVIPITSHVVAVSTRHVETPDGRMVTVSGVFDAAIDTGQARVVFEHPVRAELVDGELVVAGANLGKTAFPLESLRSVEVSQVDALRSNLLGGGITLLVGCLPKAGALGEVEKLPAFKKFDL